LRSVSERVDEIPADESQFRPFRSQPLDQILPFSKKPIDLTGE
jgi:hypothetical protein